MGYCAFDLSDIYIYIYICVCIPAQISSFCAQGPPSGESMSKLLTVFNSSICLRVCPSGEFIFGVLNVTYNSLCLQDLPFGGVHYQKFDFCDNSLCSWSLLSGHQGLGARVHIKTKSRYLWRYTSTNACFTGQIPWTLQTRPHTDMHPYMFGVPYISIGFYVAEASTHICPARL